MLAAGGLTVTRALVAALVLLTGCPHRADPAPDSGEVTTIPTLTADAGSPPPTTDAQAADAAIAGEDADAGDAAPPLLVMQPEHLAPPWDHFGRTARHEGMRDGAMVGARSVLVGCRKIRLLGDGEPRDIPLGLAGSDAGKDRRCIRVVGSDETRLFFVAGTSLDAFDVASGAVAWSADHEPDRTVGQEDLSSVAIAGPVVALASAHGRVLAFDRATGALAWTLAAAESTDSSDVAETRLATSGARLVALRRARTPRGADGPDAGWEVITRYGSGSVQERRRALASADVVRSIDAATGQVLWTKALAMADGAPALGAALAANDAEVALVTASIRSWDSPREILLLDATSAAARARAPITAAVDEYYDQLGEELTFTDGGGLYLRRATQLARIDEVTGAFRWTIADAHTSPVFARGALFVPAGQAVLRALDPASGAVVWSYGFAALRVPQHAGSDALGPPRKLGEGIAAFAEASDDGINASGQATLFATVTDPVTRRSATLTTSMVDENGKPEVEVPSSFVVLGQRLRCPGDDHQLQVRLRGNGTVAVGADPFGAGVEIPDKAVDLDQARTDYRLVFHSVFVGQGCR